MQRICQSRLKTVFHGGCCPKYFWSMTLIFICRVEKYRPDTLEDVSGHQDILATINKFVDTNVCFPITHEVQSSHVNMHHRDSLTYFSMVPLALAKPLLSSPWPVESMGRRTCDKWFWSSTLPTTVALMSCESK